MVSGSCKGFFFRNSFIFHVGNLRKCLLANVLILVFFCTIWLAYIYLIKLLNFYLYLFSLFDSCCCSQILKSDLIHSKTYFFVSFKVIRSVFRYIHLRRKLEQTTNFTERQIQQKVQRSIYKYVMCKKKLFRNIFG